MAVLCPACGKTSRDPEFCDHCNADLRPQAQNAGCPPTCPIGEGGLPLTPQQQAALSRPEASILVQETDKWWRVRWLPYSAFPRWWAAIQERLHFNSITVLPNCCVLEQPDGAWVLAETTNRPPGPWAERGQDPYEENRRLLCFLHPLADALEEMHEHGLLWLTFDPRHLEEGPDGSLRLANLDLCVYPHGEVPDWLPLKASFAAPEVVRFRPGDIGPRTDVFHLGLFAYYWLAGLLPDGFPGEGLDSFRHKIPPLRVYAPRVPVGITRVLAQALALDPARRFASPRDFVAALEEAVDHAEQRRSYAGKLRWQIGMHTRTGRTKTALGMGNEDHVLARPFADPERALLVVADGITTCDVGSGALASLIATIVVENTFTSSSTQETFDQEITDTCRRGAQMLLEWALEKGYREQLEQGADLMGTTLTAGWLEGNTLSLANLGDSRAYLIDRHTVEQLTVDGDLASGMLAAGTPPEQVRELGLVGKALRECIGGNTITPEGKVAIHEESCRPTVNQWPLLPGDILILCSDGLVEEGAFMEPDTLAEIVRSHKHQSAEELALFLADYADALQRLPSPLETEGLGDNISCIVVKIEASGAV